MLEGYSLYRGVIKQSVIGRPMIYDVDYVRQRYDRYPTTRQMSLIRLHLLRDVIGLVAGARVLDVGYGNGDFLTVCQEFGFRTFGSDVTGYSVPEGTAFVGDVLSDSYDCVTFFDYLEHMQSIDFIGSLKTTNVVVSLPWCHYPDDEWFRQWKHRRPDEHIFHFGHVSLCRFMAEEGFRTHYVGNPEDVIRKSSDGLPNILTAIFRKDSAQGACPG